MIALLAASAIFLPHQAHAAAKDAICQGSGGTVSGANCTDVAGSPSVGGLINTVSNIFTFVAGSIAVIMIVVGGVRYTTSGGDEKNVKAAKNTILYSIVGLVVVMLAYAIVNFVLQKI